MGIISVMFFCVVSFTIVDSVNIGAYANGVAFGNDYVWACDNGSDYIFKIDPDNMQITSSFYYYGGLDGLAHDGEYLWIGYWPDQIHKIDTMGNMVGSWPSPGQDYSYGMAFDGQYLWHADKDLNKIYKIEYNDPTIIIDSFFVSWTPRDLGWYGGHLWASADWAYIYELDPANMNIINSWAAGRPYCSGVALGGGYLWFGTNSNTGWVYKVEGAIGVEEYASPIAESRFEILRVYPNPFSDRISIRFCMEDNIEHTDLTIYDATGRVVKEFKNVSNNHIVWNSTDDYARKLHSGIYFLKLTVGDYTTTEKLLLIR